MILRRRRRRRRLPPWAPGAPVSREAPPSLLGVVGGAWCPVGRPADRDGAWAPSAQAWLPDNSGRAGRRPHHAGPFARTGMGACRCDTHGDLTSLDADAGGLHRGHVYVPHLAAAANAAARSDLPGIVPDTRCRRANRRRRSCRRGLRRSVGKSHPQPPSVGGRGGRPH